MNTSQWLNIFATFNSATNNPTTESFTSGKYHIDANAGTWATVRNATTGNYNDYAYFAASFSGGVSYIIGRGLLRFNFNGQPARTITSGVITLKRDTVNMATNFTSECYAYKFNTNAVPTGDDYDNFGDLYTNKGVVVDGNTITMTLNAAGVSAFQTALNNGAIISLMIRDWEDADDNEPLQAKEFHTYDYTKSTITLS